MRRLKYCKKIYAGNQTQDPSLLKQALYPDTTTSATMISMFQTNLTARGSNDLLTHPLRPRLLVCSRFCDRLAPIEFQKTPPSDIFVEKKILEFRFQTVTKKSYRYLTEWRVWEIFFSAIDVVVSINR